MATHSRFLACSRKTLSPLLAHPLHHHQHTHALGSHLIITRHASSKTKQPAKSSKSAPKPGTKPKPRKKVKRPDPIPRAEAIRIARQSMYAVPELSEIISWSLCDAMRILRAMEAGHEPQGRYNLTIRLRTKRNATTLRSSVVLPHPPRTDVRVAVIAPEEGLVAQAAQEAGAVMVGTTRIFEAIKAEEISFERLLCHEGSLSDLQRANVAQVLGPLGLMPSVKDDTVVSDVRPAIQRAKRSTAYNESLGVVRMTIGHLGLSTDEMRANIRAALAAIKRDLQAINSKSSGGGGVEPKSVHEVVLSSRSGPGLTLSGEYVSRNGYGPEMMRECE